MKVLFALFAEDIHLLSAELMTQSIRQTIFKPEEFVGRTRALFHAMHVGDYFGIEHVPQFDGWLFADDEILARLLALNMERATGQRAGRIEPEAGGDKE